MARQLGLPVTDADAGGSLPRVDAVRQQLGGRASTQAALPLEAGELVRLRGDDAPGAAGVVLFAADDERHVFSGQGRVRRTQLDNLEPFTGAAPDELRRVATDARLFASLREGQQVRYVDPLDGMTTGTLVEKCRYGALVLREGDETVLGVGFSRVWPLAAGGEES